MSKIDLENIDTDYWIKDVELPQVRGRLILELLDLSNKEYQKVMWTSPECNNLFYYKLLVPIGLLLEEQSLEDDGRAERSIGGICKNKEEAIAVEKVAKLINKLADYEEMEDDHYFSLPVYDELIAASKIAFDECMKSEENNEEFTEFIEWLKDHMQEEMRQKLEELNKPTMKEKLSKWLGLNSKK